MKKNDVIKELENWEAAQKALEVQLDNLYDLMGVSGESPLLEAIYDIAGAHTDAVARLVGDDTTALAWWKYECGYGENPLPAAIHGKKLRLISNLKQLAGLIAE